MAQNSKIEWCHHTVNLWSGCTKVHAGCDNCYAEKLSHRWGNDVWGNDKPRKQIKSAFKDLVKYQKLAEQKNEIHRVFVGSMMDIFEKSMPLIDSKGEPCFYTEQSFQGARERDLETDDLREDLLHGISEGYLNNLQFLLLTKRPSNINKIICSQWKETPPKNVIFGTSISEQSHAQTLINQLLQVNGKRFLSVEPQLTEIKDIDLTGIDWVIQGGESGHGKRSFNIDWAYTMRDICKAQNVPYFFKQIDKIQEIPQDLLIREFP